MAREKDQYTISKNDAELSIAGLDASGDKDAARVVRQFLAQQDIPVDEANVKRLKDTLMAIVRAQSGAKS